MEKLWWSHSSAGKENLGKRLLGFQTNLLPGVYLILLCCSDFETIINICNLWILGILFNQKKNSLNF